MNDAIGRRNALQDSRIAVLDRLLEIRRTEEMIQELFADGLVHGTTHLCNGQEAVSVGLARAVRLSDQVTCTYRGHGTALALGMTLESVLGEVMGREIGCVGGVGGSMHLADATVGLMPTFAIVGAGIPVGAGAALTAQVLGDDAVGVAVFGDGATNIGAFHETLNLASIWKLPAVFLCENNHFGEYSRIDITTPVEDLGRRAESYAIPWEIVDGQDVDAVAQAIEKAATQARGGEGPQFIEAKTYRFAGHSRSDTAPYRDPDELAAWQARDPIDLFVRRLLDEGELTHQSLSDLRAAVDDRIHSAVEIVKESPVPPPSAMFRHVYS